MSKTTETDIDLDDYGVIRLEQPGVLEAEYARIRAIQGMEDLSDEQCREIVYSLRSYAILIFKIITDNKQLIINTFGIDIEDSENQNDIKKLAA